MMKIVSMEKRSFAIMMSLLIVFQLAGSPVTLADGAHREYVARNSLTHAAYHGDAKKVKRLLTPSQNSGRKFEPYENHTKVDAFMLAMSEGHAEIARMILKSGARVDIITAAKNPEAAKILLEFVPAHEFGLTDLMLATIQGDINAVKKLLKSGVDVDVKNDSGHTPLLWAAVGGHTEAAKIFIDAGADVNAKVVFTGEIALLLASQNEHLEIVKMLIDSGAEVNPTEAFRGTPLIWAAINGNKEIAEVLLKSGADVNTVSYTYSTALMQASEIGHASIVKILINSGADVNYKRKGGSSSALIGAAKNGHLEIVRMLADAGASVDVQTKRRRITPLMRAAEGGHTPIVKFLLNNGAKINTKSKYGHTALINAAEGGHVEVVKILLDAGAEVNTTGKFIRLIGGKQDGTTPLIQAASGSDLLSSGDFGVSSQAVKDGGHAEVVKILLDAGADVNATNKYGSTALMESAYWGHIKSTKMLLRAGADVNAINDDGRTALMKAAYKGHAELVRMLLKSKADVNIIDKKGGTALINAAEKKRAQVVGILEWQKIEDVSCTEIEVESPLPPEVYVDRKLVEVDREFNESNYFAAAKIMNYIFCYSEENNVSLPTEFDFKNAKILMHAKLNRHAKVAISRHLEEVGRDSKNYQEALQIFDQLDKK